MRRVACGIAVLCSVVFLSASPLRAAEPVSAEHRALLKTFRSEFIDLTPGQGGFPADFEMGRDDKMDQASEKGQGTEPAERPRHRVTLAAPFAIAKYEVPQNLWQAVMGSNPSRWTGPRNSVEMLTWDEAVEFCRRATEQMRAAKLITAEQVVRLPSEAEWEYAARAGTTTRYSFGDDAGQLNEYAWSTQNASGNDPPVGALKPNAWQLYDVHGYLWEWCADAWHDDYSGAPADGSAWTAAGDDTRRVLRSGSWKDPAEKLTNSYRRAAQRDLKDDAVGLRCVLSSGQ